MGICGSAQVVVNRTDINLANVGAKAKSPAPRVALADQKNVASLDATLLGELYRAGLVNLAHKKEHCNFINVFPVPGMCCAYFAGKSVGRGRKMYKRKRAAFV